MPCVLRDNWVFSKGQGISGGNCGVFNSPKKQTKNVSLISPLASKKWPNKGEALYYTN